MTGLLGILVGLLVVGFVAWVNENRRHARKAQRWADGQHLPPSKDRLLDSVVGMKGSP